MALNYNGLLLNFRATQSIMQGDSPVGKMRLGLAWAGRKSV